MVPAFYSFVVAYCNQEEFMRANTDWFRDAKWGVFTHFLAADDTSAEDWNEQVNNVDVEALSDQLASVGAPYYFMTIGQDSGHFCSPNAAYDSIVGIEPSKCSKRDLVGDLIEPLQKRGIKLMVYLSGSAPERDAVAMQKLEYTKNKYKDYAYPDGAPKDDPDDRNFNFQLKWEAIISEWSKRWGPNVHGWWFDGCYFANAMYKHPGPPNFESFAAAAKAGNVESLVAFNPGVLLPVICYSEFEDYTAGEVSNALPVTGIYAKKPIERWLDGAQYHILSYLGEGWREGRPRFSDALVIEYTKYITGREGVVTWDVPITAEGRIPESFINQLRALSLGMKENV